MENSKLFLRFFRHPVVARVTALPRPVILALSVAVAFFLIAFLTIILPSGSRLAAFLFDYSDSSVFLYPFTIQNMMHVAFFIGMGELFVRLFAAERELGFLSDDFLPEDDQTVLQVQDLGAIRKKVRGKFDAEDGFLPYLIDLSILQLQSSRSVDQTVSVLNSSLDLINHRVDLRYSLLRYMVWVIPTLGFIGTVVGIASALSLVNPDHMDLKKITGSLGVAFDTTTIALVLSAILVFLQQLVQKREEMSVNLAGNYCLKNLINRLYVGKDDE